MKRSPVIAGLFVIGGVLLLTAYAAAQQEKPKEQETKTTVSGTVVNQKGLPVKAQALELYMIVEGTPRDAYGAPLKGVADLGAGRQALPVMMFPVKTTTDATGAFQMELPNYFMVLSGLRMAGWTIVAIDGPGKLHSLTNNGQVLTIMPKKEVTKIVLGRLVLSVEALAEK